TTTADEDNGTSDPSYGTGTSLREAIRWANQHPGADAITFNLGAGAHTINLGTELPEISTDMSISGPGAASELTIHRNNAIEFRIFKVNAPATVRILGLTIANGAFFGSPFPSEGGGIFNDAGNLTVEHCVFIDNNSQSGGGIASETGALIV